MFSKNFRVRDFKKIKINGKLKKYYKTFLADCLNKKNLLNSFTNKYSYSFYRGSKNNYYPQHYKV